MRFSTPIITLLSTSFLASPILALPADQSVNAANAVLGVLDGTTITKADVAMFPELASAFEYASAAAGCSWWKCAAIVLKVGCIKNAISARNYAGILDCASGSALCACGQCIGGLGDFLSGGGICKK